MKKFSIMTSIALALGLFFSHYAMADDSRANLVCGASGRPDTVAASFNCDGRLPVQCQSELEKALKRQYGTTNMHDVCYKSLGPKWGFKRIEIQRY